MVVLLIGFGLLCGCTGCAFWLLMSDGYMRSALRKTLSREVVQCWSRLGGYRVRILVNSSAGARRERRNAKLLVGRFGG